MLINALLVCASEALFRLDLKISGGGNSLIFPLPLLQRGLQHDPFALANLHGRQARYALNLTAAHAMAVALLQPMRPAASVSNSQER